jgi:hypothetical protein
MECKVEKYEHIRHLLYEFSQGSEAAEAPRNICAVYREDSIAEKQLKNGLCAPRKAILT